MDSFLTKISSLINPERVKQEDQARISSTALNTAITFLLSFAFQTFVHFFYGPYPWWIYLYCLVCHAGMISTVLLQPVTMTFFSWIFVVYCGSVGPIWLNYTLKTAACTILIGPVIPLVMLMISRKQALSFVSLVLECIKMLWIYPKQLKHISRQYSQSELLNFVDESLILGTVLLLLTYIVFYMGNRGIIQKENLIFEMKRQLELMNENLKKSLKERELFILSLSHEVRNPLNVVLGNIELCYEEAIDQSLKERLKSAKICGDLLLSLINNVLDAGKAELDNVEVCPTECAVVPLFEKIWSSCKEMIKNKGLKATISGLDSLPTYIKLDQHRMTQIMFNLIGNAVKFTEKGEISLKISWEYLADKRPTDSLIEATPEELPSFKKFKWVSPKLKAFLRSSPHLLETREGKGILRIEISDTGSGISETGMKGLFQKFSQVSDSTQQKKLGTGLGLWITKKICEKMKGDISVSSEPGKKTTFTVEVQTTALKLPNRDQASRLLPLTQIPSNSKKYSVMIVDDVVFNADIIARLIEDCKGFEIVKRAENGQKAVELFEKSIMDGNPINVLTMDLEMPIMNGKEACKRIRDLEQTYKIPPCYIIIISGNCLDSEYTECLNPSGSIRAQKFMRKPLRREDFVSQMNSAYQYLHMISKKTKENSHILIVDDDPFNITLIKGMLDKKQFKSLIAKNGLEAVETFMSKYETINTILMDCQMDVMDGWTATEKIITFCRENQIKPPKIYGLTGYTDHEYEKKCLSSGMAEMIKKPISFYELIRRIA